LAARRQKVGGGSGTALPVQTSIHGAEKISTQLGVRHLSRSAQGPKLKIPLPRSFAPPPDP